MSEATLSIMRRLFTDGYHDVKRRLTQRLGSADLAGEAMHEAWIRLATVESAGAIQQPEHYLFRTALNAMNDRHRRERRHSQTVELDRALEIADERPTIEEELVARAEIKAFEAIVAELPPQRRAIFLAARVGNVPHEVIAKQMRISRRTVARELLRAHEHCLSRCKELMD
jgi:RNA polymerase sigma-70 factor (ECF subfamily)